MKHLIIYLIFLLIIVRLNAQNPILYDPIVTQLDQGFELAEGPLWIDDKLLFSDVYADKIYQWTEEEGTVLFLSPSGNSNGLVLDNHGRLLMAQHSKRQVAVLLEDNTDSILVGDYNGKKLNSPNDIAVRSDGAFYFTDPPYGIDLEDAELTFSGIFLFTNTDELILLDSTVSRPNGIVLSPDESILYVSNSETGDIFKYEIDGDTVGDKTLFAHVGPAGSSWSDGMAIDDNGFLYATGPSGVWVFHPDGTYIRTINISLGYTSNCGWGVKDDTTLFVTAWQYLYKITNKEPTSINNNNIENNKLILISPNPFINRVKILYTLESESEIRLAVYTATGHLIDLLAKDKIYPGEHTFIWENYGIKPGIYFIYLRTNNSFDILKCVKIEP